MPLTRREELQLDALHATLRYFVEEQRTEFDQTATDILWATLPQVITEVNLSEQVKLTRQPTLAEQVLPWDLDDLNAYYGHIYRQWTPIRRLKN